MSTLTHFTEVAQHVSTLTHFTEVAQHVSTLTHFREVAQHVSSLVVPLGQHIEEERFHVKVQGLVFQEEFGHEAEMLAVDLVLLSVYLKEGQTLMPIDLIPRGMTPTTDPLEQHIDHDNITQRGRGQVREEWESHERGMEPHDKGGGVTREGVESQKRKVLLHERGGVTWQWGGVTRERGRVT